jgi:hypothetical protein
LTAAELEGIAKVMAKCGLTRVRIDGCTIERPRTDEPTTRRDGDPIVEGFARFANMSLDAQAAELERLRRMGPT